MGGGASAQHVISRTRRSGVGACLINTSYRAPAEAGVLRIQGDFPEPIDPTGRAIRWPQADIDDRIRSRSQDDGT